MAISRSYFNHVLHVDLPPIYEVVTHVKERTEGLTTLNQKLLRGVPLCWRGFGGMEHFSASLTLLVFLRNMYLMNPYLDPAYAGAGSHL